MEEIDLSFILDYPMLPSSKEDDYDSERDILILEELLDNYSLLLPENESFHFDIHSFSCPPAKPPDGNTGILNVKMMGDIFEQKVPMHRLMITYVSNQEKSSDLVPHQGLEIFQPSAECPMIINGKNNPILDVKERQEIDKIGSKPDKTESAAAACTIYRTKVLGVRGGSRGEWCEVVKNGGKLRNKGNVEDKILVPKLPKNYASTNVVNAPREPFVFKQDHGVNPPHIDECCYECGDALDGIFYQQCTCKSCRKGAHIGYNCPPKVPIISNPESCNQTMNNELPQTLSSFDLTCYSDKENSVPCVSKPNFVDESSNIFNPPPHPPIYSCEFCGSNAQYGHFCTPQVPFINPEPEEQAANARYWKIPACCDDDDDYNSAITLVLSTEEPDNSLSMGDKHLETIPGTKSDEVIKSSVEDLVPIPSESEGIPDTMCDVHLVNNPTPLEAKDHFEIVLNSNDDISSSDDDSLYNENIEYVEASPHNFELVSLEVVEIVIPEEEEIEDNNLREKLLNVHLLIANIKALKNNPTSSSELLTKSSSKSPKSFLEETNTFHNSLPGFENFCFDLEEISSGSTTTHSDISLSYYEAFCFDDDHIEKISSGSTTTHSDTSLSEYDSFIFDLLNDLFPPTNRSDFTHEEFFDELAHIISPPKYDCFYFRNLPDPGELISILNSEIRENLSFTTRVNLPVEDDHSPFLTYVVWIFLAYLTYPVIPPYLHSFGNEDTIFDPGITINLFYSFKPGLSYRCGTFKKFNTHRSHLNESPLEMLFSTCFLMDQ
nr:hypothetical protein [Tanacetum cinerariifolium]